jgi:hypothetical protein
MYCDDALCCSLMFCLYSFIGIFDTQLYLEVGYVS